tara:strand:+ start:1309 stop:2520 length:1212 start_codon:yes stop_codon:yes gene_type:complete
LVLEENRDSRRVIVVGGGPVGLFSAIRLSGFGIKVVLLEKLEKVNSDIRASTFHPPTLEMMEPYGITAEALSKGVKAPNWQIRMHSTGERAVFDMSCLADDTPYPFRLQFEQSELCKIMDRILNKDPLAEIRYGSSLHGLSQTSDGVTVEISEGGEIKKLKGTFLIAADGGNSKVREILGLPFEGSMYPERTVLVTTTFPFHQYLDGISNVSYCWDKYGNFSLLRLRNSWRVSMYFPEGLSPEEALDDGHIEERLQSICSFGEKYEVLDKRVYRVHQRIVDKYDHGRIILAGDAAHLNSPTGGMGMNGGLHDAHNLTSKIKEIWSGGDLSLLNLYSRQRKPVAETAIIQQADKNRKRMTEKDPKKRKEYLAEMQSITNDREKLRKFLWKSSMFEGLELASSIS